MTANPFALQSPLPSAGFGGRLTCPAAPDAAGLVAAAEADPAALPTALAKAGGLLLIPGMGAMAQQPDLMLRLSRVFGPEIEDYSNNLTPLNMVHPEVKEIFIVSNIPPVLRAPPALPEPPLTADGQLPVQFPQRLGWHTDQSYRRPPPDISLFLGVVTTPQGQGQTLFADATAAYDALPPALRAQVDRLDGIHASRRCARSHYDVIAGTPPRELLPHERPQRQPLVRIHPVTGKRALYMCEYGQMDWVDGPIAGLEPGPDGAGGRLLRELMAHATDRRFVYVHEWTPGDLVVWDNRCLLHAATWFDAERLSRVMWRTTVSGNPGPAYAGARRSWIPEEATA
jgi:taurine dioxygenase